MKKISLILVLFIWNLHIVLNARYDYADTNEVGRQWIRIIVPALMVLSSLLIVALFFGIVCLIRFYKKIHGRKMP